MLALDSMLVGHLLDSMLDVSYNENLKTVFATYDIWE